MFISTSYDHRISRHVGAHHVSCIRPADLPTRHPTLLDQDNSTAWPGYLPASHLLMRLTPSFRSHAHHHTAPEGATQRLGRLVSHIRHGRCSTGTGITTSLSLSSHVSLRCGPD